jgi:hypothetical protein
MAFSPMSQPAGDNLVLLPGRCCVGPVTGHVHAMYNNLLRLPVPHRLTGRRPLRANRTQSHGE